MAVSRSEAKTNAKRNAAIHELLKNNRNVH